MAPSNRSDRMWCIHPAARRFHDKRQKKLENPKCSPSQRASHPNQLGQQAPTNNSGWITSVSKGARYRHIALVITDSGVGLSGPTEARSRMPGCWLADALTPWCWHPVPGPGQAIPGPWHLGLLVDRSDYGLASRPHRIARGWFWLCLGPGRRALSSGKTLLSTRAKRAFTSGPAIPPMSSTKRFARATTAPSSGRHRSQDASVVTPHPSPLPSIPSGGVELDHRNRSLHRPLEARLRHIDRYGQDPHRRPLGRVEQV